MGVWVGWIFVGVDSGFVVGVPVFSIFVGVGSGVSVEEGRSVCVGASVEDPSVGIKFTFVLVTCGGLSVKLGVRIAMVASSGGRVGIAPQEDNNPTKINKMIIL